MTPLAKRILNSTIQGGLLAVMSYLVDFLFIRRDFQLAETILNDLIIGLFGGILAFVWATLLHEKQTHARIEEKVASDAVTEERNRLSREIHDICAQGFAAIVLKLEAAEETLAQSPEEARGDIISARDLARESLKELHASVWNLRPHSLENSNLQTAIEKVAQNTFLGIQMKVSVFLRGAVRELPEEMKSGLLRICQEAMTNAMKHSKASKIQIELTYEPDQVQLCVTDDGVGFNPCISRPQNGLGLTSMRERAERLRGQWWIYSAPGQGTQIQVVVPIQAETPQKSKHATA
jgi:signal transduction histidine kinase